MKRLQTVLLCVLGLFVTMGPALAGVQFIKPDRTIVSPRPSFLAVGDINADGLADVVSSSPQSKEVNVLLGNPDGVLTPGQVITVGNQLRDIALADLNGDGRPDIAVIDERSDAVFIMLNQGDSTFERPVQKSIGRRPFGIAISDFDGVRGNDLAITDKGVDRVFILLNDGRQSPEFTAGAEYLVGQEPEDIIAADFNGDGAADIVTLNLGGARRVKDVTMLLFNRVASGFPVFDRLTNFGVGEKPENMISGDFNEDGIRDLALVNQPSGTPDGQVQFLFGQGNGFLNLTNPLSVPCPFFTGSGRGCRVRALGAADLDADGMIDLAITMIDPREEKLGDILNIYLGAGDGFYVPGPVFITDPVPAALAVTDVTGDSLADILVASFRRTSIQTFVNISSAPIDDRLPGQRCDDPNQCTTTYCIDGVCCRAECSAAELCNVVGAEGTCLPADGNLPLGRECVSGDQCQSTFCTNETCCIVGTCPTDARCDIPGSNPGTCSIPLGNGESCVESDHCRTGNCIDEYCCDSACPNGRCDIPGVLGICTPELPLGQTCSLDDQCVSGICDVVGRICCSTTCAATEECTVNGASCEPERTPDPNVTMTPTVRPGDDGSSCTNDNQCDTGNCTDNVCCKVADCSGSAVCALGTGECATPTPTGGPRTPTETPNLSCGVCPSDCPCVNGLCLCAGRSGGGCSTTDSSDSRQVLLALLLPIGLLVARRLQTVRANR